MITEENNPNLKLRVFITGGGCSGFQYGFTFDENTRADDIIIENGVVMVDPVSLYRNGGKVDYQKPRGSRFLSTIRMLQQLVAVVRLSVFSRIHPSTLTLVAMLLFGLSSIHTHDNGN